jgi:hypothetical protein
MKIEELKSYREPTGGVVVNNSPYSTKYVIDFLLSELAAERQKREEVERYALQIADDLNTALSEDDDDLKAAESALAAERQKREEAEATLALTQWVEGEPPKPFRDEWFIAITTWGDKVVLRSLPEEYTYDYKTADDTYMKADKIKKWMQFPDSSFVPFAKSALAEAERRGMMKAIEIAESRVKRVSFDRKLTTYRFKTASEIAAAILAAIAK